MNHTTSTTSDALTLLRELGSDRRTSVALPLGTLPIPLTINNCSEHSAALWALTREERVDAMWAGMLTLSQLTEWTRRRPSEVPLLGSEFAWIVMRTPEWDEPATDLHDNVVHLPERRGSDRAAA